MNDLELINEKIRRNEDALDFLVQDVSLEFNEKQRMIAFIYDDEVNWISVGFGLLILIAIKILLGIYNPWSLGIQFNYILGFLTGFIFVVFVVELGRAGILPREKYKKRHGSENAN